MLATIGRRCRSQLASSGHLPAMAESGHRGSEKTEPDGFGDRCEHGMRFPSLCLMFAT